VKELGEQFAPPKKEEPKPSQMEKKLLEEFAGLRNEMVEKERREGTARLIKEAEEKGFQKGRSEQSLHRSAVSMDSYYPSAYNDRDYDGNRTVPDMATSFFAGAGTEAIRRRSRSRSRERFQDSSKATRPVCIQAQPSGGRKGSFEEILGRLGKIESTMQHVKRMVVDADFESGLDRLKFDRYVRR
jgi:hypothetical protein